MKNFPILVKFLLVLALLATVAVIAIGYMAFELKQTAIEGNKIATKTLQATIDVTTAMGRIQHAHADMLSLEIVPTASDDAWFSQHLQDDLRKFNKGMSSAAKLAPAYADQIETFQRQGNDLFSGICAKTIQMASVSTTEAGNMAAQDVAISSGCIKAFLPYAVSIVVFQNKMIQAANHQYAQLKADTIDTLILSLCSIFFAIIVVGIISFLVVKKYITLPLGRLGAAMQRLSAGDLAVTVPETNRQDEVGKMAKTVLLFQEAGLEKNRIEQAAEQTQAEIEAERRRNEAARAQAAATQEAVVNSLADGLERLSAGDLAFRITEPFASDYEKLRVDFNKAVDTLQRAMQRIAENAMAVDSTTREITQGADDMSRRTEQQAASLEQTAAALDEITVTVRKSTDGMKEAHSRVNEAKTDAERSAAVVGETVKAMSGIEESSEKISNIIGIIDEIAFQTNLLALNAGVEAARAGDAGRGFAVVATEVRALAQRSAGAAKEIKSLISASGTQVQAGVKLVRETGQALGRIVEQVARLNILVTDIANSSVEQSTALGEVNTAVNQMDQATQQNAAMVEQSTAASHALAGEAEELKRLVGQFQIGTKAGLTRHAA